ncbi:hypothetical protein KP509_08G026600 [Ceratopteris richardii]|uniref:Uncharacterized protein n=1 Tax=Ceratopteris richardii TaxID=49495 RepID=A0A8T2UCP4_CERRI|nr:hypothetical protein KP509_08G026600 [Ceratopteris richardii]
MESHSFARRGFAFRMASSIESWRGLWAWSDMPSSFEDSCGEGRRVEIWFHMATLPKLQHLDLSGCGELMALDMTSFSSLQHLQVDGCDSLKRIAGDAPSLQKLELIWCHRLEELDCKGLSSLQHLKVDDCLEFIFRIRGRGLSSLQHLKVDECCKHGFSSLQHVKVEKCDRLKRIAIGEHIPSLQTLDLMLCNRLEELDGKGLPSLEVLVLFKCYSLKTLYGLPATLQTLELHDLHL